MYCLKINSTHSEMDLYFIVCVAKRAPFGWAAVDGNKYHSVWCIFTIEYVWIHTLIKSLCNEIERETVELQLCCLDTQTHWDCVICSPFHYQFLSRHSTINIEACLWNHMSARGRSYVTTATWQPMGNAHADRIVVQRYTINAFTNTRTLWIRKWAGCVVALMHASAIAYNFWRCGFFS